MNDACCNIVWCMYINSIINNFIEVKESFIIGEGRQVYVFIVTVPNSFRGATLNLLPPSTSLPLLPSPWGRTPVIISFVSLYFFIFLKV